MSEVSSAQPIRFRLVLSDEILGPPEECERHSIMGHNCLVNLNGHIVGDDGGSITIILFRCSGALRTDSD